LQDGILAQVYRACASNTSRNLLFAFSVILTTCGTESDGGRWGYHSPEPGESWVKDAESGVTLEYFRVFRKTNGMAYVIPRAFGLVPEVCENAAHALNGLATRNGLCGASETTLDNNMPVADAQSIARYLHSRLVFHAFNNQPQPYAIPADLLALCEIDSSFRNGIMKARCDFEISAKKSGSRTEQGWTYTQDQAVLTAARLNQRYGIQAPELCERLERRASETFDTAIRQLPTTCHTDVDCTTVARGSQCHDACSAVVATAALDSVANTQGGINAGICVLRAAADCPATIHPPCVPGGVASCVAGRCAAAF
jgi:hypothetical protein